MEVYCLHMFPGLFLHLSPTQPNGLAPPSYVPVKVLQLIQNFVPASQPILSLRSNDTTNVTVSAAVGIRLDRPVTVVTAYYKIPSKQPDEVYRQWMANFLPQILVISTFSLMPFRREPFIHHRRTFPNRTKMVVRKFSELQEAKRMAMWMEQKKLDHESYHTPELYILWNEKVHFLMEAIAKNPFDSDYFLWTDIGVFFLQMEDFQQGHLQIGQNGLPTRDFQQDISWREPFLGGHMNAIRKYEKRYYETMELMRRNGLLIGKNQNIMATVAVLHPELVKLVRPRSYFQGKGNSWFYSHYYFLKRSLNETVETQIKYLGKL
ncbi:hypothetical protein BV898_10906 [Hypsibius exemplaris]|uniref:Uncharacterized protein n=1 Tax=Hypsibius exemplaris TaxID=2072580 RepID=A0A1W0WI36_HYPEX|nr:hypothetical protein BV898_10906 [Hypsibius exemplaris]